MPLLLPKGCLPSPASKLSGVDRSNPYSSVAAASLLPASATVGSIGRNMATLKKSASAFLPKRVPVGTYGISYVDLRFLIFFSSLESISGCFRSNQISCSSIFAKYRSLALCASPLSSANFISAMSNSRQPQCLGWVGKQIIFKYVSISGLWAISSSVSQ